MHYQLKKVPKKLEDIALSLCCISTNNIIWNCLYSGMGIIHSLSEKEFKKMVGELEIFERDKELFNNLVILKCIYKKGKPTFSKPPEEILNPGSYMWDFKSFNKLVCPSVQSFGILSLCSGADMVSINNMALGRLMVKNSQTYWDFTSTYLRNSDGLFSAVEDKSKTLSGELKVKESKNSPKLIDQLFIFEALLMLYHSGIKNSSEKKHEELYTKYTGEALNIFNYIFENYNQLMELTSKEISLCISSLSRCCSLEHNEEMIASYRHLIALLCAELETRIKVTGEVERNFNDLSASSFTTHFRAASALMEGYIETGIEKFKELSLRIYNYVEYYYDPASGLFTQGDSSDISCSIRDTAEILKSLLLYYTVIENENILEMLSGFYTASIQNSGIVQSIYKRNENLLGHDITFSENIPLMEETQRAPVFMRSFRISREKVSTCTVSRNYHSFYGLYSSYLFLHYFKQITKNKEYIS